MIEYKECSLIYREKNKNVSSILAMRDYQYIIFNKKNTRCRGRERSMGGAEIAGEREIGTAVVG
jgi:hypothetical protein